MVLCVFSFVCGIVLGLMDIRASRILKRDALETGNVFLCIVHAWCAFDIYPPAPLS